MDTNEPFIRSLVHFEGKKVYRVRIIEGVSGTILAGMASLHKKEFAIQHLLHVA
jgi:hypothetical protein